MEACGAIYEAPLPGGCVPCICDKPLGHEHGHRGPLVAARLEDLRAALRAENISWGELLELQSLADYIEPGDVELAEPAGIDEQEFAKR